MTNEGVSADSQFEHIVIVHHKMTFVTKEDFALSDKRKKYGEKLNVEDLRMH